MCLSAFITLLHVNKLWPFLYERAELDLRLRMWINLNTGKVSVLYSNGVRLMHTSNWNALPFDYKTIVSFIQVIMWQDQPFQYHTLSQDFKFRLKSKLSSNQACFNHLKIGSVLYSDPCCIIDQYNMAVAFCRLVGAIPDSNFPPLRVETI